MRAEVLRLTRAAHVRVLHIAEKGDPLCGLVSGPDERLPEGHGFVTIDVAQTGLDRVLDDDGLCLDCAVGLAMHGKRRTRGTEHG